MKSVSLLFGRSDSCPAVNAMATVSSSTDGPLFFSTRIDSFEILKDFSLKFEQAATRFGLFRESACSINCSAGFFSFLRAVVFLGSGASLFPPFLAS